MSRMHLEYLDPDVPEHSLAADVLVRREPEEGEDEEEEEDEGDGKDDIDDDDNDDDGYSE